MVPLAAAANRCGKPSWAHHEREGEPKGRGCLQAFLVSTLVVACLLSGCSKPKKRADDDKKEKEEKPLPSLAIGGGDTTIYGSATATAPSFTVRWKAGQFDVAKGTVSTGHLDHPEGEIFSNGKASSTYRADTGNANRELKRLDMRGDVILRSADGKQTLKAPAAQYRGDVKIIRATGGVVATGTFGTLSGVPELWATPDLRLIGTPDMVSKTLKMPALVALAATTAFGTAKLQNGDEYTANSSSQKLDLRDPAHPRVTILPPKDGPLIVQLPSRGLMFRFTKTVEIELVPKSKQVRHMTSSGTVNVVQTTPNGTDTIDGTNAEYDSKPGADAGDLTLGGRVTLVARPKTGGTTTSKGDRGTAVLVTKPTGNETGLRRAVLIGNVTIDSVGTGDDSFKGTGDRLVYEPKLKASDVDLSGRVVLTRVSKGPDGSNTVVSRGERAHALLDETPAQDASPLQKATLTGGVTVDVSGTNGQTFSGIGDQVVYRAEGAGGTAVMMGQLKFSGSSTDYFGTLTDVDTATVMIGKGGVETVETSNTNATPTTTRIQTKQPPAVKPPAKSKKKGGKP